jgi:hypothetical protein
MKRRYAEMKESRRTRREEEKKRRKCGEADHSLFCSSEPQMSMIGSKYLMCTFK